MVERTIGSKVKKPTKKSQNSGKSKVGYKNPPKERQFGQPNGNPRGHGFFKVEDTARAKLEKMITLKDDELLKIFSNQATPTFEKNIAQVMLAEGLKPREKWSIIREMIDEIYGYPKQSVSAEVAEIKPMVDLRKRKKNGNNDGADKNN